jgi:acyl-[acyl-carrier-protein]-phospholipid O-acyltransferase/long-chain-fatty-acid--[acyl-carrier-protein] ligase
MQTNTTSKPLGAIRGIGPFFGIGFLNAFNDVGLKTLLYDAVQKALPPGPTLVAYQSILQALVLIPFVAFFTPAGYLSDKWAKDKVIRWSAFAAIPLAIGLVWAFHAGSWNAAFALLLLLASQAAFYSPSKYGFVKELVGSRNLAGANSIIQGLTIVAILLASFLYSVVFEHLYVPGTRDLGTILRDIHPAAWPLLTGFVLEWVLSLRVPRLGTTDPDLRFSWSKYVSTGYLRENLRDAWGNVVIRQSIIGLSVFFAVNQVLIANLGSYMKETTGQENTVVISAILAAAAVGMALGAVYAARLSKDFIETGLVPAGAAGVSLLLFALPHTTHPAGLGLLFLGFGFFGGMFLIPLNALIQFHTRENTAGHIVASNNFAQNVLMLLFLAVPVWLSSLGVPQRAVFVGLGVATFAGSIWAVRLLPQSLIRTLVRGTLGNRYKLVVLGLDDLPSDGGLLLLGNHISFIDWAILQMASPRPIRFVMERSYYEKWYLSWLLDRLGVIPISSGGAASALSKVREALAAGDAVALFPEGHLTRNGHLSTFRSGFEKALSGTGAQVVPFYIQGLWGSIYSHASAGYRQTLRSLDSRVITVAFGKPLPDTTGAAQVKQEVQELSISAWESHVAGMRPLASSWIRTAKRVGSAPSVLSHDGQNLSGTRLLAAVLAFSRALEKAAPGREPVGILLPPSSAGIIANLAVLSRGRPIVNLNYTQSPEVLAACVQAAGIRYVLSSRQFETKLAARGFDLAALSGAAEIVRMEDLKEGISKFGLLRQLLRAKFLPAWWLELTSFRRVRMDDTAAILFSSGSEGTPKGVELSHANMVGNLRQTSTVLNPDRDDVILCALPLFHAFGLTITTLMPLVEGIPVATQPDPTDARAVGRACARHKVTILCGTSTFLRMYVQAKAVQPLMFQSLRMVVAGAEKLRPEVRSAFKEKFGLDVYEGYGSTETTPVASTNIPDALLDDFTTVQVGNKPGTVGLPLPGTRFRIVDPESLEPVAPGEAGLVLIGGTQIMKGYLGNPEKTESVLAGIDGRRWYRSGDKGRIDEDGFLQILDRYSRFAKLGGEMVSLGAVETALGDLFAADGCELLATAVPDPGKGERVVALYCAAPGGAAPEPEAFLDRVRSSSIPPLSKPSLAFRLESLPRLGSGKPDYSRAKSLASELAGS